MKTFSSLVIGICVASCLMATGCKDDKGAGSKEESEGMRLMNPTLFEEEKKKALEAADLPPIADDAPTRFPVEKDGKWGYIDRKGEIVIDATFDEAHDFYEGLAAAKSDGLFGYIDADGTWVIEPQFTDAGRFSEGLAAVHPDGEETLGFVDRQGEMAIPAEFTWYFGAEKTRFSEGLAPLKDVDKENVPEGAAGDRGYIDTSGEWAIAPKFRRALPFSEGLAPVELASFNYAYIDKGGNVVLESDWERARPFSEGLAAVGTKEGSSRTRWHYIDKEGNPAVEPVFGEQRDSSPPSRALSFSEGLAAIYHDGAREWEFIEPVPHGTEAIYTKIHLYADYEDATSFRGGLARVKASNARDRQTPASTIYINREGEQVWPKKD